ncbi:hypothetical protein Leryth_006599, partial [Lithospermum erythrorhizon]
LDFSALNEDPNFDFSKSIETLIFNLNPFDPTQFPNHHEASHASSNPYTFLNNNYSDIFQSSGDAISFLKVDSPESNGSNKVLIEEFQGSGKACSNNSVSSSPNFDNNLIKNDVIDLCFNLDGHVKNEGIYVDGDSKNNGVLKRKKDDEDYSNSDSNVDTNSSKHRKSSDNNSYTNVDTNKFRKASDNGCNDGGDNNVNVTLEEEEKRKARLEKNRESAQLSRQRKKHYVVELEDKVRIMHSTIQDLNAKISYIIAENSSLKQQMGGGGVVPSPVADAGQQPPGMYPPPSMMFPWVPGSPYMVKGQGSQVPLLPIPRLKSRQVASALRTSKKTVNKKSGGRTQKVASVSFLGLLFFMLLFGGLAPMVNVRYGRMKNSFMGRSDSVGNGQYEKHHGKLLTINGSGYGESFSKTPDINSKINCAPADHSGGEDPRANHGGFEFVGAGNGSKPLMASLYVPRNDKLVKIDGNLIIHSILASEKATTPEEVQQEKKNDETGLAIPGDLVPSDPRRNTERHPRLSIGSGVESENLKADRQLHQWFREGLAGPMLSSGKCTEVFQFDVVSASAPGGIIPATSASNVSRSSTNSTHVRQGLNRRILHGLPFPPPGSPVPNLTEEGTGRETGKGNFAGNNSSSSMVVSVLLDPREAADAESDGVMGPKSNSRMFVVVLVDGVKYVTYSCKFPFKGEVVPHLVTA